VPVLYIPLPLITGPLNNIGDCQAFALVSIYHKESTIASYQLELMHSCWSLFLYHNYC